MSENNEETNEYEVSNSDLTLITPSKEPKLPWQKLILKLDKYIDPKYAKKKRYYSIILGMTSCSFFNLLMLFIGLPSDLAVMSLVFPVFCGILFMWINELGWRDERYAQQQMLMGSKRPLNCGCQRDSLPTFDEQGWLISRVIEHYTCTIYEILANLWVGWIIATVVLLILNWIF